MNARAHIISFSLAALALSCGCDSAPQPTYQSPRRILAISYRPPADIPGTVKSYIPGNPPVNGRITQYLLDTNVVRVLRGHYGDFQGRITATTLCSNEAVWRVELRFDGKAERMPRVDTTNVLEVPYPQAARFNVPGIGTVTGWFLSDREIDDLGKL